MPAILSQKHHAAWLEAAPDEALALIKTHLTERRVPVGCHDESARGGGQGELREARDR